MSKRKIPLVTGLPTYPETMCGRPNHLLCYVEIKHAVTDDVLATTCAHSDWGLACETSTAVMRVMEAQ